MIFEVQYGTCIFDGILTHQQEYTKSSGLRQTKSETHPNKSGKRAAFPCGRIYGSSQEAF
jgi:hypothetical protein